MGALTYLLDNVDAIATDEATAANDRAPRTEYNRDMEDESSPQISEEVSSGFWYKLIAARMVKE